MRSNNIRRALGLGLTIATFLPASPASAANATVNVVDKAFTPNAVTIESGESVTWNFNSGTHNVHVTEGPVTFDSGYKGSGSFTKAFTTPGVYRYVCDAHSEMRGTVTVNGAAAAAAAPAPAPGAPAASAADTTKPTLSAGRVSSRAVLRLRASEAATLHIRFVRGGRTVRRGTAALKPGANRVALRVRGLRLGRYRVRVHAVDAAGNRSATATRSLVLGRAALSRRTPATPPAPAHAPAAAPAAPAAAQSAPAAAQSTPPADDSDGRVDDDDNRDDERERDDD